MTTTGTPTLTKGSLTYAPTAPDQDERVDPIVQEPGDRERFAHYIVDESGRGMAAAQAMQAMFDGTPVRALCGKVWVPTRDPKRFPVCPTCEDVKKRLQGPRDEDPQT